MGVIKQTENPEPVALACYEQMASRYADMVEDKAWNAAYERPALLALLPALKDLRVFEAGCGPGFYTEYCLQAQVAQLTAVDVCPEFVTMTRRRVEDKATVLCRDLERDWDFLADQSVDLIVSGLAFHYLRDWRKLFEQCRRVLTKDGLLVFSTHHPCWDIEKHPDAIYFHTELIEEQWSIGTMRFYHRPLTEITESLAENGFVIERLVEPKPLPSFAEKEPEAYERLCQRPNFLLLRARKEG